MHPGPKTGILGDPQPIWDSFFHPFVTLSRGYGSISFTNPSQKCNLCLPGSMGKPGSPRIHRSAAACNCVAEIILTCDVFPLTQLMMASRSSSSLPCRLVNESLTTLALPCVCVCTASGWQQCEATVSRGRLSLALSTLTKETD